MISRSQIGSDIRIMMVLQEYFVQYSRFAGNVGRKRLPTAERPGGDQPARNQRGISEEARGSDMMRRSCRVEHEKWNLAGKPMAKMKDMEPKIQVCAV